MITDDDDDDDDDYDDDDNDDDDDDDYDDDDNDGYGDDDSDDHANDYDEDEDFISMTTTRRRLCASVCNNRPYYIDRVILTKQISMSYAMDAVPCSAVPCVRCPAFVCTCHDGAEVSASGLKIPGSNLTLD